MALGMGTAHGHCAWACQQQHALRALGSHQRVFSCPPATQNARRLANRLRAELGGMEVIVIDHGECTGVLMCLSAQACSCVSTGVLMCQHRRALPRHKHLI